VKVVANKAEIATKTTIYSRSSLRVNCFSSDLFREVLKLEACNRNGFRRAEKYFGTFSPGSLVAKPRNMGEYGMKFEKSRKRKFDGGGDRRGSKKQKWNKNPGQSGSNAIPLGTRGNGTGVDSDERVPTSISRPHISNGLPAKDTEKWTEKKEKRKRESQKLLDAAVSATEKSSTPKEGKAKKKKKLGDDRNVATDGSRVDSKLHGGIVDKGEKESLDLTDDAKAVHSEQPKSGEETADRTANEKKERFICFVGMFLIQVG